MRSAAAYPRDEDGSTRWPSICQYRGVNKRAVGSPADALCPTCQNRQAKVALNTDDAVFFRCAKCREVWAMPTRRKRTGAVRGYGKRSQ